MTAGDHLDALRSYYERGQERERLDRASGALESDQGADHAVPAARAAVVADIGGGPGRYALWLAALGYQVRHCDVVPCTSLGSRMSAAICR